MSLISLLFNDNSKTCRLKNNFFKLKIFGVSVHSMEVSLKTYTGLPDGLKIAQSGSYKQVISLRPSLSFIYFFYVSSRPSVGLELMTPKLGITCFTN